MMRNQLAAITAIAIVLTSCATPEAPPPFSEQDGKDFVASRATIDDVKAKLGKPKSYGSIDGERTIMYLHLRPRFRVGAEVLVVRFDKDGRAVGYQYQE